MFSMPQHSGDVMTRITDPCACTDRQRCKQGVLCTCTEPVYIKNRKVQHYMTRSWSRGTIAPCHGADPGSSPGLRNHILNFVLGSSTVFALGCGGLLLLLLLLLLLRGR